MPSVITMRGAVPRTIRFSPQMVSPKIETVRLSPSGIEYAASAPSQPNGLSCSGRNSGLHVEACASDEISRMVVDRDSQSHGLQRGILCRGIKIFILPPCYHLLPAHSEDELRSVCKCLVRYRCVVEGPTAERARFNKRMVSSLSKGKYRGFPPVYQRQVRFFKQRATQYVGWPTWAK
jgi:hypothetical protein